MPNSCQSDQLTHSSAPIAIRLSTYCLVAEKTIQAAARQSALCSANRLPFKTAFRECGRPGRGDGSDAAGGTSGGDGTGSGVGWYYQVCRSPGKVSIPSQWIVSWRQRSIRRVRGCSSYRGAWCVDQRRNATFCRCRCTIRHRSQLCSCALTCPILWEVSAAWLW